MVAREFLKQVEKLDRVIENKLIEKEQLKSMAESTTSGSTSITVNGVLHSMEKVQASANPQKMADAINRYIDIETEIDQHIDELLEVKKDVCSVIEQLKTAEYDLLHKVYIQHMELWDAADKCEKSYAWAKATHRNALKNVQRILDQREEAKSENS